MLDENKFGKALTCCNIKKFLNGVVRKERKIMKWFCTKNVEKLAKLEIIRTRILYDIYQYDRKKLNRTRDEISFRRGDLSLSNRFPYIPYISLIREALSFVNVYA